jgi:hypothetical protein
MFDEWRERRNLKREINLLQKEESMLGELADHEKLTKLHIKLGSRQRRLAALNTDRFLRKVRQLGIELPHGKDSWWWDDLDYAGPDDYRSYLTDIGEAGISKLIRDERRKNFEWWVKIVVTVITALTGLVGSLIGVLSVLNK